MILEKGTGVPNYVAQLYAKCLQIDPANEYVFFQPNRSRQIGATLVANTRSGSLGAAQFDCWKVTGLVRRAAPDIYHGPAHILPLQKRRGTRYVVTIHDLAIRILPRQYDWKLRWYYRSQLPRSLRIADSIIAVSHHTRNDLIRLYGIPPERIEVIYPGVADRFLDPPEKSPEAPVSGGYFLSISTHPKRKNILGALNAFALVAAKFPLIKYVIAGVIEPRQLRELRACAESLGLGDKVVVFGYADDRQLVDLYRGAEFLIYPSFYEGFGLPVVEAMLCGCPVIAADTSSLPEIVPDREWLADPYDVESLAAAIRRMLELPPARRADMVCNNQRHARSFSWEKAARRTIEVFQKLVSTTGASRRAGAK
jgi:glycosyltransferase involved in cell wall biosynthesis